MMTLLTGYRNLIYRNYPIESDNRNGLAGWRNMFFAKILYYFLPLSAVALIPRFIVAVNTDNMIIITVNVIVFSFLLFISFNRKLGADVRKILFLAHQYIASAVYLLFLGAAGAGLIHLVAITIFALFIFNEKVVYLTVLLNALFCFLFAFFDYRDSGYLSGLSQDSNFVWATLSSNVIGLCVVFAVIAHTLLKEIREQMHLREGLRMQLEKKTLSLEESLVNLQIKNEELEDFSHTVSHDLQEPLRMVTSFLSLLETDTNSQIDEKGKKYIHFATDGAARMKKIISGLLDFATAGNKKYQMQKVDLTKIVGDFITQNQLMLNEKVVTIKWSPLPTVVGDYLALTLMIQNLLTNAVKYQKEGSQPSININGSENGDCWQIDISDNGIGIDPIYFDKIFLAFHRLHTGVKYPGSGIGLSTCKKIADQHNGKIWVSSAPEGGSVFSFTISKHLLA